MGDIGGKPVNMMNNLAKVIMKTIYLRRVKGCQLKMFEGVECERVFLHTVSVDSSNPTQTIRIPRMVHLHEIQGDIHQLLDLIETNSMLLSSLTLNRNSTKSLTRMLQDRVIELYLSKLKMDYKLLTEYDGNGICQYIDIDSDSKYFKAWVSNKRRWKAWVSNNRRWKYFKAWVSNKRRWKMSRCRNDMKMSREDYSP